MLSTTKSVECPICAKDVLSRLINEHIDSGCKKHVVDVPTQSSSSKATASSSSHINQKKISLNRDNGPPSSPLAPLFTQALKRNHASTQSSQKLLDDDDGPSLLEVHATRVDSSRKRSKHTHFQKAAPLAERMRPDSLSDYIGQNHLTGPDSLLMKTIAGAGSAGSVIFWGPPGCGKTTLARLLARHSNAAFKELSATSVGTGEVRTVLEEAKSTLALTGRKTVLFLDEVHRFNKAQQDIFLPYVEQGHIQLVGATTENPSFKLTGALLSRCRVFVLERLTEEDIRTIVMNAVNHLTSDESRSSTPDIPPKRPPTPPGSSQPAAEDTAEDTGEDTTDKPTDKPVSKFPQLTEKIISTISSLANGDARVALSLLELVIKAPRDSTEELLLDTLRRSVSASYDRAGDSHYDMISALHKSVRGSDGSAAMYWLARMLVAGEDPLYIVRRMVVCASEDIGLADAQALPLAIATLHACQNIGMPECRINLAHLVAYLSEAPKSTRAYEAYARAEAAAKLDTTIPVPMQIRNAPTKLMKELGYGESYKYNPEYSHPVYNRFLPIQFVGEKFLRDAEDKSDKNWDEQALMQWEMEVNGGKEWEGRGSRR